MVLRIAEERLGEAAIVRVMGRLGGAGVEELSRACREAGAPLRLDLSGLLHADEVGLALLRSLRDSGAELTSVSPFIQLLLDGRRTDGC
jgi:anti-anti-sigma regulatory factor